MIRQTVLYMDVLTFQRFQIEWKLCFKNTNKAKFCFVFWFKFINDFHEMFNFLLQFFKENNLFILKIKWFNKCMQYCSTLLRMVMIWVSGTDPSLFCDILNRWPKVSAIFQSRPEAVRCGPESRPEAVRCCGPESGLIVNFLPYPIGSEPVPDPKKRNLCTVQYTNHYTNFSLIVSVFFLFF